MSDNEPCSIHGTESMYYHANQIGPAKLVCLICSTENDPELLESTRAITSIDRINKILQKGPNNTSTQD